MVTSRLGIRPLGVPNEGSGALQDTAPRLFPGAPSFPTGRQPEELAGTEGGGWTQLLLTLHRMTTIPPRGGGMTH